MLHTVSLWLLAAAFAGAGLFNAIGTKGTRKDFVGWGYPTWWCHVTGALEIATAVLVVFVGTRQVGLVLGALVIVAAIMTVVRNRDFSHLVPWERLQR